MQGSKEWPGEIQVLWLLNYAIKPHCMNLLMARPFGISYSQHIWTLFSPLVNPKKGLEFLAVGEKKYDDISGTVDEQKCVRTTSFQLAC